MMDYGAAIGQQLINGVVLGLCYALLAFGLNLIVGILGIMSFAQGEFYMLGGVFTFAFMQYLGLGYVTSILASILIVAFIGALAERFLIKPLAEKDMEITLLGTFAISIILMNLLEYIFGNTPQKIFTPFKTLYNIGPLVINQQRLVIIIAGILLVLLFNFMLKNTKFGISVRATSQNKVAANLVGINVAKTYTLTFGMGCFLAAIAGALMGPLSAVYPSMGQNIGLKGFVVIVLGGMGSLPGAVYGGIILGVIESLGAAFISSEWKDLIGYGAMILILLFKPQGLFGRKGAGV